MITSPERFEQARPAGFDGVFDWDFLAPAFDGTKIMPMDIDAIVERHGKFLLFETKETNKSIPMGQKITLEKLVEMGKGNVYLIILYGKTADTVEGIEEWYYSHRIIKTGLRACNAEFVLERVKAWFDWANR